MQQHAKIASFIVIIGFVAIGIWKLIEPTIIQATQQEVSDAGENGTILIGVDGWVGYFPLCSPEIKRRLNRQGYGLRCIDDNADYELRLKKLKKDDLTFAVATVDSYLLNGKDFNYPGPIVSVIDESKGGDAIVARKSVIPNLETLKSIKDFKVSFTPNSPSHHLLKSIASHFDIPSLKRSGNHILSDGSTAALKSLNDKKSDLAVLWEPEVSIASSNDEYVRLLGTEDTQRLIVDILIASQDVVKNKPELVTIFLKSYFETLKHYRVNEKDFINDISTHYRIDKKLSEALLAGVEWVSLIDNAEIWFGTSPSINEQALVDTIESAVTVLIDNQDFSKHPLQNADPYSLLNSKFISQLYEKYAHNGSFTTPASTNKHGQTFQSLTENGWKNLREVGSLKTRNIQFSSGTDGLDIDGKKEIDLLIEDLKHYPNFRIEIRGHSGLRGDRHANKILSQDRADAVLRYIDITHNLQANRMRSIGFGSDRPLPQLSGESNRAYAYRLPRVEIALLREEL
jgi:outer membrane protein OmpA-like peptidoglycan-associated protein